MRAILINPEAETVTEVDYSGPFTEIYKLIGADTFDVVHLGESGGQEESMFVDDVGLLKEPQFFFTLDGNGPFAGRALILGTDNEGETVGTKLTAAAVAPSVVFKRLRVKDWTDTRSEENAPMPWGGTGFVIHGAKPIFEESDDAPNP